MSKPRCTFVRLSYAGYYVIMAIQSKDEDCRACCSLVRRVALSVFVVVRVYRVLFIASLVMAVS